MAARRKKTVTQSDARDACRLAREYVQEHDDETVAKEGLDIGGAYYWNEVRSLAKDYLKRAKEKEFSSDEELEEDFQQTIDGHQFVVYTWWARVVLLFTDNIDAYEEEMGDKPATVEQQAYGALMKDVREHSDFEEALDVARRGGDDE